MDITYDDQLIEISMRIILNAGDARVKINEVLNNIAESDFDQAEDLLTEAKKIISKAHAEQTNTIQGEARGESIKFSLLFAHAQDTLMTVMSELNTAKRFIAVMKKYDERLKVLEA